MDDWFAHWFDEDYSRLYAHRDEAEARHAVALALQAAPELAHGPVLDLGCGAGRHLAALRETNPEGFGLDLSAHLLGEAPSPLRPWLVRGDMRLLPIRPGTLTGVLLWFTPFGYFSDQDNRSLLLRLAEALRPGGVLLLDYLHDAHVRRTLQAEEVIDRPELRVCIRRSIEGDRVIKRMALERSGGGARREVVESVHLYSPQALTALAADAGLRPRAAFGSYGGSPFSATSDRWIGLFERGSSGP